MSVLLKCLSHTPLRGLNDPAANIVEEVDAVLEKTKADIQAFDPEVIFLFAPDHYNGLFYDLMPPFVVATAADSVGDYKTPLGSLSIPADLALDLVRYLFEQDIDMALSHRLQVDHGCTQILMEATGSLTRYPVIPIIINSVAPPFIPYRRIRKLGEAVGQFAQSLGKRVLILGSGGLSHEPPVPLLSGAAEEVSEFLISGRNPTKEQRAEREARTVAAAKIYGTPASNLTPLNEKWDRAFMQVLMDNRLHEVDDFEVDVISKEAGRSTHEVRTWVAAFAALSVFGDFQAKNDYYRAINEWIAGYGVVSAVRA